MSSSLEDLIFFFSRLPGLGPKSSKRLVLYLLKNKDTLLNQSLNLMKAVKDELSECLECGNIDVKNPCHICSDSKRNKDKICVVEDIADLWAIEKTKTFDGTYHVLGGVLSAVDGIGPDDIHIEKLLQRCRINVVEEIILATNATVEGQLTAQFIADKFSKSNIFVSRLAHGIPIGGELDYIDEGTLSTAFKSRNKFK